MIFVAIMEHSPAQCPGHVKEVFNQVSTDMGKLESVFAKHNAKPLGIYIMYASHRIVAVVDAPSYEAAEMVMYDSGLMGWNTIQLGQAHTPEEAMQMGAAYHGVG